MKITRTIYILFATLLSVVLCPIQGNSQTVEVIRNGNFDTLIVSWAFGPNARWMEDKPNDQRAYSPPYCGEIQNYYDNNEHYGIIQQDFVMPPHTRSVKISFNYIASSGLSTREDCFFGIIDGEDPDNSITLIYVPAGESSFGPFQRTLLPKHVANLNRMINPIFDLEVSEMISPAFGSSLYRIDDVSIQAEIGEPIAEFGGKKTVVAGSSVSFSDSSTAQPTEYLWKFYDGSSGLGYQTSTDKDPSEIIYANAGTFDVSLTVTNPYGTNTIVKENFIKVSPNPNNGVEDMRAILHDIKLSPNPVARGMEITSSVNDVLISVYNVLGELVSESNTAPSIAGLYLARIEYANQVRFQKVVVE